MLKNTFEDYCSSNDNLYGTPEECKKELNRIAERFDSIFPHFFETANNSYIKKCHNTECAGFIDYICNNLFVLLRENSRLSFDNCSLRDLYDFKVFFNLFGDKFIPDHQFENDSTEDSSVSEYPMQKAEALISLYGPQNITLKKFCQVIQYQYTSVRLHVLRRHIKNSYRKGTEAAPLYFSDYFTCSGNAYDYEYFANQFVIDKTGIRPDQFNVYGAFRLAHPDPAGISFETTQFENFSFNDFMYLFWWTYSTLAFQNDSDEVKKEPDSQKKIVTRKEKEKLTTQYAERLFCEIEGNKENLQNPYGELFEEYTEDNTTVHANAYFESCFILLNKICLFKNDESLCDLLAYIYAVMVVLCNNKDEELLSLCYRDISLNILPDQVKELISGRKHHSIDTFFDLIYDITAKFFCDIKEKNESFGFVSDLQKYKYKTGDLGVDIKIEMDNWFLSNNLLPATGNPELMHLASIAEELINSKCHRKKDIDFLENLKKAVEIRDEKESLLVRLDILYIILRMLNMLSQAFLITRKDQLKNRVQLLCFELSDYLIKDSFDKLLNENEKTETDVIHKIGNDSATELEQENNRLLGLNACYQMLASNATELISDDIPFDNFLNSKMSWVTQFKIYGSDEKALSTIEKFLDKLIELIEKRVSECDGYDNVFERVVSNLEVYTDKAFFAVNNLSLSPININDKKACLYKTLSTGEYLYNHYMLSNGTEIDSENFDYSCVALQYYKALEFLINNIFYIPYKKKFLDSRDKNDGFCGYIGEASFKSLCPKSNFKNSLELGTFAYLFKGLFNEKGDISQNHTQLHKYLSSLGMDNRSKKEFAKISEKILDISKPRNKAAHGSTPLSIADARDARKSVFENSPMSKDEANQLASEYRELIPRILALFA